MCNLIKSRRSISQYLFCVFCLTTVTGCIMAAGIKYHPHWQQTHAVTVKTGFRETLITNAPLKPQTPNFSIKKSWKEFKDATENQSLKLVHPLSSSFNRSLNLVRPLSSVKRVL